LKRSLSIFLYLDPISKTLYLPELVQYLKQYLGRIKVEEREDFFSHFKVGVKESLAKGLAEIRVKNAFQKELNSNPLPLEVEVEKRTLSNHPKVCPGVLYDGFGLQGLFRSLIPPFERTWEHLHIIFTHRLLGTWEEGDRRYHIRVIVCGYPSLISTSGIVEGPAKPKEFYRLRRIFKGDISVEALKENFQNQFIDYDDSRLTEVMKGYLMQAVLFHLEREPFCSEAVCRLFNAHWQEEVLKAQLTKPEFCKRHEEILRGWKEKFTIGKQD